LIVIESHVKRTIHSPWCLGSFVNNITAAATRCRKESWNKSSEKQCDSAGLMGQA
jgi:hypothetical protein